MPSPTLQFGVPAIVNPGTADAVSDLPASQWPSLERIGVVDLVGPTAANRQERSLQRRSQVLVSTENRLTSALNYVTGAVALTGDYARSAHPPTAVACSAGVAGTSDTMEHYLARDGGSVMWGRFILGSTRTLLYPSCFDVGAYHWFQGPGSADVLLADADLAWGVKRLGINDYELYVWRAAAAYRVLTTYDAIGGFGGLFLAAATNGDRVVGDAAGAALAVEATNAISSTPAKIGVRITGVDTFWWQARKGFPGVVSLEREAGSGLTGSMWKLDASGTAAFIRSKPTSFGPDLTVYGISVGFAPVAVTEWGVSDYGFESVQIPYGGILRVLNGSLEAARFTHGQQTLDPGNNASVGEMSNFAVRSTSLIRPRVGFVLAGVSQCAMYYDGIDSGKQSLRVRGNDGFDDRLAYISDVGAPGGGGGAYVGTIIDFGGPSAPPGYIICDGAAVSRTLYADLFTVIGETFGVGDGSTTFNLPDFRRKVSVGAGGTVPAGSVLATNTVGTTGGTELHTLAVSEIPAHTHAELADGSPVYALSGGQPALDTVASGDIGDPEVTGSTGGGDAHNNIQPSLIVNKCIRYVDPGVEPVAASSIRSNSTRAAFEADDSTTSYLAILNTYNVLEFLGVMRGQLDLVRVDSGSVVVGTASLHILDIYPVFAAGVVTSLQIVTHWPDRASFVYGSEVSGSLDAILADTLIPVTDTFTTLMSANTSGDSGYSLRAKAKVVGGQIYLQFSSTTRGTVFAGYMATRLAIATNAMSYYIKGL